MFVNLYAPDKGKVATLPYQFDFAINDFLRRHRHVLCATDDDRGSQNRLSKLEKWQSLPVPVEHEEGGNSKDLEWEHFYFSSHIAVERPRTGRSGRSP